MSAERNEPSDEDDYPPVARKQELPKLDAARVDPRVMAIPHQQLETKAPADQESKVVSDHSPNCRCRDH